MLDKIFRIFQKKPTLYSVERMDWAVLGTGVTFFVIVSLATITKSSIWFDEAFGAYLIRFDFWEIARYTAADVHPPFYYWILKMWSMVFGASELALRSMSLVFMVIALIFAFLITKRLFGRHAAWISLLVMIVSPMILRYSQEMRMYALVSAIAFAATYVLVIATASSKRSHWAVYGILVGLGMLTHYFSLLIWLSHWVWRASLVKEKRDNIKEFSRRFFTRDWIIAHIIAVGIFLPWVPSLVSQISDVQTNGFWIPPVVPATITNYFTNILFYQDQETLNPWATLVFLGLSIGIISLAVKICSRISPAQRRGYLLIAAIAFIPMILIFLASMPPLRPSFIDRYLIPSTIATALFIGITIALSRGYVRKKWLVGLTVAMVGAMVFGQYNVTELGNYNKTLHHSNNTRQMIEAITQRADKGEPIVADTPWLFYEAIFYSTPDHPVYFIDASTRYEYGSLDMLRENDQFKIKDLDAFAQEHPVVWYLGRPESNDLKSPGAGWRARLQVMVNDSVSGGPSYKAIQYRTADY